MANYATLKAAISAAIKQNGNNEITGNLLQQQLLAMVNSLGVGYLYAGIATPETNPGTPDQNVFYLASTAGTYTNFRALVLADGEIAILKYNGAWSKDSTGAASLEKVNQLGQDVKSGVLNVEDGIVLVDNKSTTPPVSYFPNPLVVGGEYEVTNTGNVAISFTAFDADKQALGAITDAIPAGHTKQFTFNYNNAVYIGGYANSLLFSIALKRVDFVNKLNTKVDDSFFGELTLYHKKNAIGDTESFPVKMKKGETYTATNKSSVQISFVLNNSDGQVAYFTIQANGIVKFVCPDDVTTITGYGNTLVYSVTITRVYNADFYTKQDAEPIIKELVLHEGYYIHANASAGIFQADGIQYSNPFFVKKGQRVHLECKDQGAYTAIAKYNYYGESGVSTYTQLVNGINPNRIIKGVRVYDYTATDDMYIAVCGPIEYFYFYLDTNINFVLKEETKLTFSTNNNVTYSVAFRIHKGHRYLVKNTGNIDTSCVTKWSKNGDAIDKVLSEATVDSRMNYSLLKNSWGIFIASGDANYLEGWSSASTTIEIEDITDKPAEYFGKLPNIIWQCRDGRVSSVQYPPQTKWAILETAKNQYDRVRFSIQKTTDGKYFLCHDLNINFLATNPDGTDISGGQVSATGKTLDELNYYDWGHRFGDKYNGMNVPMLEDGLYYANMCNLAVTAEFKFTPTEAEMDELWGMFVKYNVDKHLMVTADDNSVSEYFATKSQYVSYEFGGTIENFRNNIETYKALKTEYNQIYYLIKATFGVPPTDAEIAEVKSEGFATWFTPIFNKDTLLTTLGFAKGMDMIECANIPFIKSTVREYADSVIVWP